MQEPEKNIDNINPGVITNMESSPEYLIKFYCKRGLMENFIKESKTGFDPAVVEELLASLSLGEIQKVLQNLIREQIPIRDLVTIFEALADYGKLSRSVDFRGPEISY